MPDAVIVRLLKGNALLSPRLEGGTKKFPRWDKPNELVHSGTDCPFLVLIHLDQTSPKPEFLN